MARYDYRELTKRQQVKLLGELASALSRLKSKQQMAEFLKFFLTKSEVVMLTRRLQIAKLLIRGKTFDSIRNQLGVGIATVRFVDRWLEGQIDDYRHISKAPKEFKGKLHRSKKATYDRVTGHSGTIPGSMDDLRHRYSGPFLLLNILLDYRSDPEN